MYVTFTVYHTSSSMCIVADGSVGGHHAATGPAMQFNQQSAAAVTLMQQQPNFPIVNPTLAMQPNNDGVAIQGNNTLPSTETLLEDMNLDDVMTFANL